MKIGYFADGPWSHLALDKILADSRFEIAFIVPRYETQDPILRIRAKELNVDYLALKNVNAPESIRILSSYAADIFVSMSFDQILREKFLRIPPCGVINCHAGQLPFYRGRNILNWVLINNATQFGVTVHYVDEGIDTGDIILQKLEAITDADTYRTLLDRAIVCCAEILHEALCRIATGNCNRIVQQTIHPIGFYLGRRKQGDEWIDWNWPSRRIFDFVRGICYPGPGARTMLDSQELCVESAHLIRGAPDYIGTPGEVVGVNPPVVTIKTGDSTIQASLKGIDGPIKLRIGHRLKSISDVAREKLEDRLNLLEQKLLQFKVCQDDMAQLNEPPNHTE